MDPFAQALCETDSSPEHNLASAAPPLDRRYSVSPASLSDLSTFRRLCRDRSARLKYSRRPLRAGLGAAQRGPQVARAKMQGPARQHEVQSANPAVVAFASPESRFYISRRASG